MRRVEVIKWNDNPSDNDITTLINKKISQAESMGGKIINTKFQAAMISSTSCRFCYIIEYEFPETMKN